ncbi:branched-chain amino acid transaminase [Methanobrevibacter filiformis]|uniref:Branched-chain-amino-acid aminotransferase n=1 Tax=Methanobrevibacter filiformis TaxID=55758 RepID=A0A166AUW5_9EURY|nr:branched-chain amino acid transaminase [Methanobrevibacter filiformis]KZX12499.1 branched-chain-amino-acid aminotransferase [Methanobrevibacter filiformis]
MSWDENGKIWMDGEFVDWKQANIHVLSHVIHYGSSVFEGIRAYKSNGKAAIFRLEEHVSRLFDSAKIYKMEIPYSEEEIANAIKETIAINNLKDCYIRPISYRGYGSLGVNPLNSPINTSIAVWKWGKYLGDDAIENGADIGVSSWRRMAPNTLPSMSKAGANYMNAQLAKLEAIENNYDECIMLDYAGYVGEGSGENIFLIKDEIIYTPSFDSSILSGITSDSVKKLAKKLGYEVQERKIPREFIYLCDEIFFTGTAAEVTPIRTVDGITIGTGKRGPITEEIQSNFFNIATGKLEDEFNWLTYIE